MGLFGGDGSDEALRLEVGRLTERVARLERIIAALPGGEPVRDLGPHSYEATAEVRLLAQQGNKIEAIKRVREETGLGLKEAKDVVDGL